MSVWAYPTFSKAGEFKKYWDATDKQFHFIRLVEGMGPLVYPRRSPSLSPGGASALLTTEDINPSNNLKHIYEMYLGIRAGLFCYLFHPYTDEQLNWDENPTNIDRDLTRWISYRDSPYECPTVKLWVKQDGYPGLRFINISDVSLRPEYRYVAMAWKFQGEDEMPKPTLEGLRQGVFGADPIRIGGRFD